MRERGDVESKTGYHKLEFALGDLLLVQGSVHVAQLSFAIRGDLLLCASSAFDSDC